MSLSSYLNCNVPLVCWELLNSLTKWVCNKLLYVVQGGMTCGTIDEPKKSSKAIDERVIIDFCDKNVVIAHFCDKNVVITRFRDKNVVIAHFRDKYI